MICGRYSQAFVKASYKFNGTCGCGCGCVLCWCAGTYSTERDLEIQLKMKGRLRGQAFITFPSTEQAARALEEVHGYILKDKPMIIVRPLLCRRGYCILRYLAASDVRSDWMHHAPCTTHHAPAGKHAPCTCGQAPRAIVRLSEYDDGWECAPGMVCVEAVK